MVDLITALNDNLEIAEIPPKYRIDNDVDQVDYEHEEYDDEYDDSESKEDYSNNRQR